MLQQDNPEAYVIASEHQYSVRTFVNLAAKALGIDLDWQGKGVDERAIDTSTGKTVLRIDKRYFRPTEVHALLGDASKARNRLGWKPEIGFEEMVREMVDADQRLAERDALVAREGFSVYRHLE